MLWAGDGEHNHVTDVERFPAYDVFLCAGWNEYGLALNVKYLETTALPQIICKLDVKHAHSMRSFCAMFAGKFDIINADYYGHTPTLDTHYYGILLSNEGRAYNIEGIHNLTMPCKDFYKRIELFAPYAREAEYPLTTLLQDIMAYSPFVRYWAKISDMSPSHLMSSPDFKDAQYRWAADLKLKLDKEQDHFMTQRKWENPQTERGRMWFLYDKTIEKWWDIIPMNLLTTDISASTWSFRGVSDLEDNVDTEFIQKYKPRFLEYLHSKIKSSLIEWPLLSIDMEEVARRLESTTVDNKIQILQKLIKEIIIFKEQVSDCHRLRAYIAPYIDDRKSEASHDFKLYLSPLVVC